MSKLIEEIKETIHEVAEASEEITHNSHPKLTHILLILRNIFVSISAILLIISIILHQPKDNLKAIAYFCGGTAYILELLAVTDCLKTKVPYREMFMIYCFGPLYLIMGLSYIL